MNPINIKNTHHVKWIESAGGPLVLLPKESIHSWLGISSDHYDNACSIIDEIGLLQIKDASPIILGDEPFPTTFFKNNENECYIVRWVYGECEKKLLKLLNARGYLPNNTVNNFQIDTDKSGKLILFDSAIPGKMLKKNYLEIHLLPLTTYKIEYYYLELDSENKVLINKIYLVQNSD